MSRSRYRLFVALAVVAIVAGCGGDDDDTATDGAGSGSATADVAAETGGDMEADLDEASEQIAEALGGGGGGTLSFDGEEIEIDSVVCALDGELFDVGTVSASGHRVLLSWTNEMNPVSISVLDPDFQQWSPEGDDLYERDGKVFTSATATYFADGTDETLEIGFTVECP